MDKQAYNGYEHANLNRRKGHHMDTPSEGTVVYEGKLIRVRKVPVSQPDGRIALYDIVDHPDAVGIVAIRTDLAPEGSNEPWVALVHQARPAIGKETWEIPAGLVDSGEEHDGQRTAERELLEETGFVAASFEHLHTHYPSPGFMNEAIALYLARGLTVAPGAPAPDVNEISALEWKPLREAMRMCVAGEIDDGKTVIGLWLARDVLENR